MRKGLNGGKMLAIKSDPTCALLEMVVDGPVARDDYQAAVEAVDALLKTYRHINVVEVVRNTGWVAPDVWWADFMFHLTHHNFLHRVAVVSDKGWVAPMTRFFAPFYPAEVRTFAESELEEARAWASEKHAVPDAADELHLDFA
jgi:hypothetical protein